MTDSATIDQAVATEWWFCNNGEIHTAPAGGSTILTGCADLEDHVIYSDGEIGETEWLSGPYSSLEDADYALGVRILGVKFVRNDDGRNGEVTFTCHTLNDGQVVVVENSSYDGTLVRAHTIVHQYSTPDGWLSHIKAKIEQFTGSGYQLESKWAGGFSPLS